MDKTSKEERNEILDTIFDLIDQLGEFGPSRWDYQKIIHYCELDQPPK